MNKLTILPIILLILSINVFGQPSRIELRTINSPALGIEKQFNIYLPEGYDQSTDQYPVVYLFRGHEREWVNPQEDIWRQGRNIKTIADSLYDQGLIGKMILVMPGLSSSDVSVVAWTVNLLAVELAGGKTGLGTGQFEDYFINDLIPYVDENFRTIPSRWSRGADGFSFGGLTSMMISTKHPDLFSSVGSFDGTGMWLDFNDPSAPEPLDDFWVTHPYADPHFGRPPRNIRYMKQYNPANNIKYANIPQIEQLLPMQFLITAVGSGGNLALNEQYVILLDEKGIQNNFPELILHPSATHNWYWADHHIYQTLQNHWERFQNPLQQLDVQFSTLPVGKVSGLQEIEWSMGAPDDTLRTMLSYSRDAGKTWNIVSNTLGNETGYQWNTLDVPDGCRSMLMVSAIGNQSYGIAYSIEEFTIDNPGNGLPDAEVFAPRDYDTLSGVFDILWYACDPEDDPLKISLSISVDNGITWLPLAADLSNSGEYSWNTRTSANGSQYHLKLTANDGMDTSVTISGPFTVYNDRTVLSDDVLDRVEGYGDGSITINVVDADELTGHRYRLTFDDSNPEAKTYSVYDIDKGALVVANASEMDGKTEGPYFDGVRLIISDIRETIVSRDSTRWIVGSSDLTHTVNLPEVDLGDEIITGIAYPADYEIRVYDTIVDTSSSFLGAEPVPMRFTVWNVTENRKSEVIYLDWDNNGIIGRLDEIFILENDDEGEPYLTWHISFSGAEGASSPVAGDVFRLRILKPFTGEDVLEFTPIITSVNDDDHLPQVFRLYQNYPNPFNPSTVIRYQIPEVSHVKLTIYNLLGQKVVTLVDEELIPGVYEVIWDANGTASGMYLYRLTVGDYKQMKKLILLK